MAETTDKRPRTIAEVSAFIRRNWPKERSPLRWRKVTERIIRSHCDRFQVERRGEGDAVRYFAFLLPTTVIGYRILTAEQAKQICEQHASPLPLEAPREVGAATTLPGWGGNASARAVSGPSTPPMEREPGCDDE